MSIVSDGQFLRISVAFLARDCRRGYPRLAAGFASGGLINEDLDEALLAARQIIEEGAAFASGVPQYAEDVLAQTGLAAAALSKHCRALADPPRHIAAGMGYLAYILSETVKGSIIAMSGAPNPLQDDHLGGDRHLMAARRAIESCIGQLREGLFGGTSENERHLVTAACEHDEYALYLLNGRESERLGHKWLYEDPDDLLGPPLDPSEGGPLGVLWPRGAPEWYPDDMDVPVFTPAREFPTGSPRFDAAGVVLFPDHDTTVEEIIAHLARIGQSAVPGRLPPQRHVYLSSERLRAEPGLASHLVVLGATVWRESQFTEPPYMEPPYSEVTFAEALRVKHRHMLGRGQLISISDPGLNAHRPHPNPTSVAAALLPDEEEAAAVTGEEDTEALETEIVEGWPIAD